MITTIDKALASAIVGGLGVAAYFGFLPFELTPEIEAKVTMLCAAAMPFITWLIPNKPKV